MSAVDSNISTQVESGSKQIMLLRSRVMAFIADLVATKDFVDSLKFFPTHHNPGAAPAFAGVALATVPPSSTRRRAARLSQRSAYAHSQGVAAGAQARR